MAKSTAVTSTQKKGTELAAAGAVSLETVFADAADTHLNFQKDDLAIPFIRVLQTNSPEVNPRDPKYVSGAKAGDFYNTVTQQIWDGHEGMTVIPVAFTKSFTEWRLREAGGGFIKDHGADPSIMATTTRDEKNRDITNHDPTHHITRAALYYIVIADENGDHQTAALALSSTQLKKANAWNARIAGLRIRNPQNQADVRTPKPYYMAYRFTTVQESNDKGTWMGVKIEPVTPTLQLTNGDQIYLAAKDYESLVGSGVAKVQAAQMFEAGADEALSLGDEGAI